MPLSPGSSLGPYEVLAPLGAGGMGEVYRARDTRLGRDVAIKVLPAHLSQRPEVRARFEREAKTISSLNHPNICALYDIGREGDVDFLVMELVEGETLATRLEKGPLPLLEVMRTGAQIADALDRAHRAGVVHRDLKPGNVMLTRAGAKLLDFGLARATGMAGPASGSGVTVAALSQSPTVAQPLTAEGTIVGTFQYMAPEQLEGREADARADIWAFGCMLYEMATGRRAFDGQSQASLIGSIMKDEPRPLAEVAPLAPPALDRVVRRCLAKDPDDRWQSAADMKHELDWITQSSSQSGVAAPLHAKRRRKLGAVGGALIGAAVAAIALLLVFQPWRAKQGEPLLVRFPVRAPVGQIMSPPAEAAISPDGQTIAFVTFDSTGTRLFLRPLGQLDSRRLAGTDGAHLPFWSPDGKWIGFFSQGKLRKVALDGSAPLELCDATDARGGSWAPNGTILFVPNNQGGVWRVSAGGGAPVAVTTVDTANGERGHRYPQFLPDGKHFLYVAIGGGDQQVTYAMSVDGGKPKKVLQGGSGGVYAPPGYLLYLDAGVNAPRRRLLARRFDAAKLVTSGDALLVLDRVSANNFGYANVAASPQGTLVVQHWAGVRTRLEWRDRSGRVLSVAADDLSDGTELSLAPDGHRIAFGSAEPPDLYALDLDGGVPARLTFEEKLISNPAWSRDGRRIAFGRLFGSGRWDTYVKNADGTGADSLLIHGPGIFAFPVSWSPDGRWMLANISDVHGLYSFWKVPLDGSGPWQMYDKTTAGAVGGDISPDGAWAATIATGSDNRNALTVQSFPNPGARYQIGVDDPQQVFWSPRGSELIVVEAGGKVVSVPVSTEGGFRQGAARKLFQLRRDEFIQGVSPDGQRILVSVVLDVSNLISLEVVMGWEGLLKGR